jgi:uncharacterized protein YkwD
MATCYRLLPLVLLAALPTAVLSAETSPKAAAPNADQQQRIRQALATIRLPKTPLERRVKTAYELVAIGRAGVSAFNDYLDKDLARLKAQVKDPPSTAALDEKIEKLRKTLADLRALDDLSKEQLKDSGLPALDELTAVYGQREGTLRLHYAGMAKVAAQLQPLIEFLKRLETPGEKEKAFPVPVRVYRKEAEELLAQVTQPVDEKIRSVLEENVKIGQGLPPDVVEGMRGLNAMRIMCGVQALRIDLKLCEAAHGHSADMEANNFFAHDSPLPGKKTPWDRAAKAGTTASGENIYAGGSTAVDAIKAWFLSPGHHKNMLGAGQTRQGLGRVGKHWTQMFGH